MNSVVQFAVLGLGLGAVYALLGQGIVLIYRGSGVLNLAHGGFATIAAFVFIRLHSPEAFGAVTTGTGWPLLPAMAAAVGVAAALGALTHLLVMRRLRAASPLARLVATLAILLILEAAALRIWGVNPPFVPNFLPSHLLHLGGGGIVVNSSYLWLVGIAVILTAILTVLWRFTRVGWATAAVSHSERSAAAIGISPDLVSTGTWAAGAALAGLAGVLITPITQITVTQLSLTVIAALAAVLLGGFESFPATLASGLAVGVGQSILSNYQTWFSDHLHVTDVSDAVPLLVIVIVLAMRGSSLPLRGHMADRLPSIGTGRVRWRPVAIATAVLVVIMLGFAGASLLNALTLTFAFATVLLSLVVVTGYAGQVSLAQYTVAGVGGLISAQLTVAAGFTFVAAAALGVLGAVLVGLAFAMPALRTRGVNLAVVTLAFAWAAEDMVFNNPSFSGSSAGLSVGSPHVLGFSLGAADHPARYAVFAFVIFAASALVVANLRRSKLGRRMIAVRSNERAAAAAGIGVFRTKLIAFAIAGAIAGFGGIVISYQNATAVFGAFDPITGLQVVSEAVIGGIGFVFGSIAGAVVSPGALLSLIGLHWPGFTSWLPFISGGGALLAVMINQDGIVGENLRSLRAMRERWGRKDRPADGSRRVELDHAEAAQRVPARDFRVRDISVRYGGVVAVQGLSFDVSPGEILGLIGPNGAGKTTVMDAVSGFTRYSGTVELGGAAIDGLRAHRRVDAGLVRSFQGLELFSELTVLENLQVGQDDARGVELFSELLRPRPVELSHLSAAVVRDFGLADHLDRIPDELSYGQRRLVAIARAVVEQPSVLLLDEPVAGLSDRESAEFSSLVRSLADVWGMAVVVIEHDMDFVMQISDRLVVMDFGREVCHGTPAAVRTDPAAIAAYLGDDPAAAQPSEALAE